MNQTKTILVALCLVIAGCSKSGDNVGPIAEIDLIGTYTVAHSALVGQKSDSVFITIINTTYTTTHFGPDPRFCDVQGTIVDYRRAKVDLVPDEIFVGGCDSLRIPRGTFDARYAGDTVILERKVPVTAPYPGDSVFTLFLLPAK